MAEWDSALWIWLSGLIFAISHSLLASRSCKAWCYGHGLREPRYRLLYSILAIFTTALWLFYVHQLPDADLYQIDGVLKVVLVSVQMMGLIVVMAAFYPIDGLVFLGLRKPHAGKEAFIVRGIYRYIRHPMYAGVMLILLAMPEQSWNGLHVAIIICLYFIIGSRFEERRMLADHPDYAAYRKATPAFIPGFK